MKLEYRRDIQNRYLILTPDQADEAMNYEMKMLVNNEIPGFAPCTYEYMNGSPMLYYDISGFLPLTVYFGEKKADAGFFRKMITAVLSGASTLSNYLLGAETLLLLPETVLTDSKGQEIRLISCPFEKEAACERTRSLAGFLFSKTDKDAESIRTAYRFYTACSADDLTEESLMEALRFFDDSARHLEACRRNEEEEPEENFESQDYWEFNEEANEKANEKAIAPERIGEFSKESGKKMRGGKKRGKFLLREKFSLKAAKIKNVRKKEKKEKKPFGKAKADGWREYKKPLTAAAAFREDKRSYRAEPSLRESGPYGADPGMREFSPYGADPGMREFSSYGVDSAPGEFRSYRTEYPEKYEREQKGYFDKSDDYRTGESLPGELAGGETEILRDGRTHRSDPGKKFKAWLIPENVFSDNSIELTKREYLIGRGASPGVVNVGGSAVSRRHAKLLRKGDSYEIMDLNSRNGTEVNGIRLADGERRLLEDGDRICFADVEYSYQCGE